MRALVYDRELRFTEDYPVPEPGDNESLIRVTRAGICNTDLEILRGYMAFQGIPGHEFAGVVEKSSDSSLIGKRVAGEINAPCGKCDYCYKNMPTHCTVRSVLGILNRNGVFAEYTVLPDKNLHILPDTVTDDEAVFIEPLAAAFRITEQLKLAENDRVCILGDGKLGMLTAQVLALSGCETVLTGHHMENLALLDGSGIKTVMSSDFSLSGFDVVVDCTGSRSGLETAMEAVRSCGTIVMKTTVAEKTQIDLNRIVVNEITLLGSRCGPFEPAIRAIENKLVNLSPLISKSFQLEDGIAAFHHAGIKGVMKVILCID
ncbi:MAG: alcohol dehydrogenase catalytic domain-containing protein [Nitrospira sp.]|nr:alcohol dehydrogenase catalytic domain-containing protein [bacterium]MBL7049601.1 alcohol dehydrogenase catalytic domain-containing protein [Nitrospira sp.]